MTTLTELADRVEAATGYSNELDILSEIALFEPDAEYVSVRVNAAGTKLIYTSADGKEKTHWARDWTISPAERAATAASLRAHASKGRG